MKKTWRYPLPVDRFRGILRSLFFPPATSRPTPVTFSPYPQHKICDPRPLVKPTKRVKQQTWKPWTKTKWKSTVKCKLNIVFNTELACVAGWKAGRREREKSVKAGKREGSPWYKRRCFVSHHFWKIYKKLNGRCSPFHLTNSPCVAFQNSAE